MRLEFARVGLLVELANHYTTGEATSCTPQSNSPHVSSCPWQRGAIDTFIPNTEDYI